MSKQIDPQDWQQFLAEFSERNRGRRARFELFHHAGEVKEEEQEAYFEGISVDGRVVTVRRADRTGRTPREMSINLHDTHGIAVQFDTDGSEDTLELTNHKGDMTVLHFESMVDGDS